MVWEWKREKDKDRDLNAYMVDTVFETCESKAVNVFLCTESGLNKYINNNIDKW